MATADREKALEAALAQIDKHYGKGSVMRLGDEVRVPLEVIPTGSIALDLALGIGGLPRGRVVEIYGPESSGKTTVALHAIANAQAAGGICAFIDAEHALDPDYAAPAGSGHRQPAGEPARQRRAGAGDLRHAGPVRCDRTDRDRLRRLP
jgi:recombination protein RecA